MVGCSVSGERLFPSALLNSSPPFWVPPRTLLQTLLEAERVGMNTSQQLFYLDHCRISSCLMYLLYINTSYAKHTSRGWHCGNRQLSRSQMKAYATPACNQFTLLLKITCELNPFSIDLNGLSRSFGHMSVVSVNTQQCFYTLLCRAAKIISVNKIM